jgi:hypothetical protein
MIPQERGKFLSLNHCNFIEKCFTAAEEKRRKKK